MACLGKHSKSATEQEWEPAWDFPDYPLPTLWSLETLGPGDGSVRAQGPLLLPRQGLGDNDMITLGCCFSRVRLFMTLWTIAGQAPLSMGFSRQDNKWAAISYSRDLPDRD